MIEIQNGTSTSFRTPKFVFLGVHVQCMQTKCTVRRVLCETGASGKRGKGSICAFSLKDPWVFSCLWYVFLKLVFVLAVCSATLGLGGRDYCCLS